MQQHFWTAYFQSISLQINYSEAICFSVVRWQKFGHCGRGGCLPCRNWETWQDTGAACIATHIGRRPIKGRGATFRYSLLLLDAHLYGKRGGPPLKMITMFLHDMSKSIQKHIKRGRPPLKQISAWLTYMFVGTRWFYAHSTRNSAKRDGFEPERERTINQSAAHMLAKASQRLDVNASEGILLLVCLGCPLWLREEPAFCYGVFLMALRLWLILFWYPFRVCSGCKSKSINFVIVAVKATIRILYDAWS